MLRTLRFLSVPVLVATLAVTSLSACGAGAALGKIRTDGTSTSTKKDCGACKKMCEVGGNAEKNESAVNACKKDCEKSCQ